MDGDEKVVQSDSAHGRRAFLKRMAAFAFAAPVISSFVLDSPAFAGTHDQHGKSGPPNQHGQNQGPPPPNQYNPNQTNNPPPPNQYNPNQTHNPPPPNQYNPNQTQEPCGPDGNGREQGKGGKNQRHR